MILALLLQVGLVRPYAVVPLDSFAVRGSAHTHVQVTGLVTLVRREADGDLHIRLSHGTAFVIAECIPKLPCRVPHIGEQVTVRGISRYDLEHRWWEIHSVEEGP